MEPATSASKKEVEETTPPGKAEGKKTATVEDVEDVPDPDEDDLDDLDGKFFGAPRMAQTHRN